MGVDKLSIEPLAEETRTYLPPVFDARCFFSIRSNLTCSSFSFSSGRIGTPSSFMTISSSVKAPWNSTRSALAVTRRSPRSHPAGAQRFRVVTPFAHPTGVISTELGDTVTANP